MGRTAGRSSGFRGEDRRAFVLRRTLARFPGCLRFCCAVQAGEGPKDEKIGGGGGRRESSISLLSLRDCILNFDKGTKAGFVVDVESIKGSQICRDEGARLMDMTV